MFDIGFSEIVLIVVIALLVVGPQELPTLVRNMGAWMGKARRFMGAVKTEFDREIHKADEIKRLMSKEMEIAEQHENLDLHRRADPSTKGTDRPRAAEAEAPSPAVSEGDTTASAAKQDHGTPQT